MMSINCPNASGASMAIITAPWVPVSHTAASMPNALHAWVSNPFWSANAFIFAMRSANQLTLLGVGRHE